MLRLTSGNCLPATHLHSVVFLFPSLIPLSQQVLLSSEETTAVSTFFRCWYLVNSCSWSQDLEDSLHPPRLDLFSYGSPISMSFKKITFLGTFWITTFHPHLCKERKAVVLGFWGGMSFFFYCKIASLRQSEHYKIMM